MELLVPSQREDIVRVNRMCVLDADLGCLRMVFGSAVQTGRSAAV